MGEEYRTRIFKSGNSVALRLPKALGLKEGVEVVLREERQGFSVEPVEAEKRKIRGDWIGRVPGMDILMPEERVFAASPRVWDDADWLGLPDKPA